MLPGMIMENLMPGKNQNLNAGGNCVLLVQFHYTCRQKMEFISNAPILGGLLIDLSSVDRFVELSIIFCGELTFHLFHLRGTYGELTGAYGGAYGELTGNLRGLAGDGPVCLPTTFSFFFIFFNF